ncbi:Protein outspread [Trachymyrmex septentrionalis]|uniref:Protein outspread n=1 Tax=Trachymyrmex septentrionalis TaxID=34720 RepID=A0A195F971_9HYME|nr:Protein outspread [Trachymyrmex septentrionalis]
MSGGTAGGGGGGGGGVRGTGVECRKFAPNIFNKSKCSSCFKQKEEHSAEALECNRSLNVNPKDSLFASKSGSKNMQFGKFEQNLGIFIWRDVERSPIHTAVYTRSSRRCEILECRQPCDLFSVHSSHLFLQHPYERRRPPPRVVGLSAFLPFVILSHDDGDTRCATHRKSIRGDKNLILFVIHLFDEAYKRTSRVQDRALRRPLERREAGMMDGGAVNKMKRPESCLPLFGRHPLRDQRDIFPDFTTRTYVSLVRIIFRGCSLRYSIQSSRRLPRIIACLCLARLDNSSHQVGVAATVCKHCNGSQASRGHFLLHFIALRLKWRQEKGVEISSEIIKTSSRKRTM